MTSLAGYRQLTKRDFTVSKVAAFGLVSHQKVLLAKRPVTRRFAFVGRRAAYFDVSFVTDAECVARDAVDLTVTYRSAFSRRSIAVDRLKLFADPHQAPRRRQRIWLCPPRGARFADVAFARRIRGHKVALDGVLQLASGQPKPTLAQLDNLLRTHDLSAMTLLLAEAEAAGDRDNAQRLLARMQHLSHSHEIYSALASLRDARDLEQHGIAAVFGGGLKLPDNVARRYSYANWLSQPTAAPLPIEKQVRAEALALFEQLCGEKAGELEITPGEMMLPRLLAAAVLKVSDPTLKVSVEWEIFSSQPQCFGPWLAYDSGASFLATGGGKAVQSVLLSDQ